MVFEFQSNLRNSIISYKSPLPTNNKSFEITAGLSWINISFKVNFSWNKKSNREVVRRPISCPPSLEILSSWTKWIRFHFTWTKDPLEPFWILTWPPSQNWTALFRCGWHSRNPPLALTLPVCISSSLKTKGEKGDPETLIKDQWNHFCRLPIFSGATVGTVSANQCFVRRWNLPEVYRLTPFAYWASPFRPEVAGQPVPARAQLARSG